MWHVLLFERGRVLSILVKSGGSGHAAVGCCCGQLDPGHACMLLSNQPCGFSWHTHGSSSSITTHSWWLFSEGLQS